MEQQWHKHFIEVDSWGGHIGNLYWCNSQTMPACSPINFRLTTYWGCFVPHLPVLGRRYTEEVREP
jgi:hypothetical protein